MNNREIITQQIEAGILLKQYLKDNIDLLEKMAEKLVQVFKEGHKVVLFGNGGSAADAQHIAAELEGKFYFDRPALPALILTGNISTLTAIANDFDYRDIFLRQVAGLVTRGDAAIGLSTSGNSENVIRGLQKAAEKGAVTFAFTGAGGKMKDLADFALAVPSTDTPRIQEAHITAGHIICYLIEKSLFGKDETP